MLNFQVKPVAAQNWVYKPGAELKEIHKDD